MLGKISGPNGSTLINVAESNKLLQMFILCSLLYTMSPERNTLKDKNTIMAQTIFSIFLLIAMIAHEGRVDILINSCTCFVGPI